MDKLNYTCSAIDPIAQGIIALDHLSDEENEHGSHLLALSIHHIMRNPIEQRNLGLHGVRELLLKEFHFQLYGQFDLTNRLHPTKIREKRGLLMLVCQLPASGVYVLSAAASHGNRYALGF